MTVFDFNDYRQFISAQVDAQAKPWGTWGRLAKIAGCQATYLSQVMKGKAQLTPDHVYRMARHWEMTDAETDFFLLLLERERVAGKELRAHLEEKMKKIRREREDLAKRFAKERVEAGEKETLYYSAWYWAALHVIVTIPEYQTPAAIARRLNLPVGFVEQALKRLADNGFVKQSKGKWAIHTADVHVPKESVMIGVHHNNWRQRAVTDSTVSGGDSVHFTGVYSLSRTDYQHLKEKMLELIEHSRKVVAPSAEEELACFLCDLFTV